MTKKRTKKRNPADIEFTLSDLKMVWRSLRAIESDSDRRASFWRDHIVLKQYKSSLQRKVAARRLEQETKLHRSAKELASKIEQRMRWLP